MKKGVFFLSLKVKLSSLFQDRAYAFPSNFDYEKEKEFATKVLKKASPRFKLHSINPISVTDYCDIYSVINEKGENFKLKISLDDSDKRLSREITSLNSQCPVFPKLVKQGSTKVGDEVKYLITQTPLGESVSNYGRSTVIKNFKEFVESYSKIAASRSVRNTYKNVLNTFSESLVIDSFFSQDVLTALKSYDHYSVSKDFLLRLKGEVLECFNDLDCTLSHKCHGSLSPDSIFYGPTGFYFDTLDKVCMGHPFMDFADFLLEMGVDRELDYQLLAIFCEKGNLRYDKDLFKLIEKLQLRKKLGELLIAYISEVYLYGSYRFEKIFAIASTFSHCYERFCKIEIFLDKKDFIMKTICEPIFGVKA